MKQKFSLLMIISGLNLCWYFLFVSSLFNFWFRLIIIMVLLNLLAFNYHNYDFEFSLIDIIYGFFSALILYFIFVGGKYLSSRLFLDTQNQIMSLYALKRESHLIIIILALILAGIGEEIFWRGFLQDKLAQAIDGRLAYLMVSLVYGGVHLWTGNFILVLAALTAGFFWGYLFLKTRSMVLVISSHVIWDLLVFILFPLNFD